MVQYNKAPKDPASDDVTVEYVMQQIHQLSYRGHIISWKEVGTGSHTFVLLPGWSGGSSMWERTVQHLAHLGRCIMLELPGHYPAQAPEDYRSLSQEELIELEMYAIQQICSDTPLTLIGHSTGGMLSLAIAARMPLQVRRVVSINGVLWGPLTGVLGIAQWLLRHRLYGLFWIIWKFTQLDVRCTMMGLMFYTHRWMAHWRSQDAWQLARHVYPFYKQYSLPNLAVLLQTLEHCDIRSDIDSLTMPVLLIVGTTDPIVPPEQSFWAVRHIRCATAECINDTGHVPFVEDSEKYERTLMEWLKKHPA
jgi:pimeloyl-ACP methyl ester carboxylesterase